MSERPARARLFAGLDLPEATRDELAAWAADATRGREGLRLIDATMLHVTLCFIGWREEGDAEAIGAAVTGSAAAAPELAVGGAAWLPPRRPRVLAVDLQDAGSALTALQRKVSDALVSAAGYAPERRPYRPHVTVARVRASARLRPFALDPPTVAPFRGTALTLYRSFPQPGGARYDPVARVRL